MEWRGTSTSAVLLEDEDKDDSSMKLKVGASKRTTDKATRVAYLYCYYNYFLFGGWWISQLQFQKLLNTRRSKIQHEMFIRYHIR